MIPKFTSSKEIVAKIYRDLNLTSEDRTLAILEYIGEALEHLNSPIQFVRKEVNFKIQDRRVAIPPDLIEILSVSKDGKPLTVDVGYGTTEVKRLNNASVYRLNGDFLYVPFDSGKIRMLYLAYPTDDECFPLIPDDISFKEAISRYCIMKLKYPDALNGQLDYKLYKDLEVDWHFYCKQARAKALFPNMDMLESIRKIWNRMIPYVNSHSKFYEDHNVEQELDFVVNKMSNLPKLS